MFAMPNNNAELVSMRAGKMNMEGRTVTADARKGMLVLRKSEDGLMHLIWKDRATSNVEDDLIVFEGDASIRRVEECTDGFCMLVEFNQMDRKLFFYSQEPRKKGGGWEDVTKEKTLLDKANSILTGTPVAGAGAGGGTGALGMTQAELLAMLGGTVVPAAVPSAAAAPAAASGGEPPATTAPAAAAPAPPAGAAFSADAISSILSGIPAAPAAAAPTAPATPAGAAFSADAISNILGNIGGPPAQPMTLNDVLRPEDAAPKVDAAMEVALAEHLPQGGVVPDSVQETLTTPQMAQAAMRFTEALYQGEAAGLMREMHLNPTGLGVEPFLVALQASTDAAQAPAASSDASASAPEDKMDVDES